MFLSIEIFIYIHPFIYLHMNGIRYSKIFHMNEIPTETYLLYGSLHVPYIYDWDTPQVLRGKKPSQVLECGCIFQVDVRF